MTCINMNQTRLLLKLFEQSVITAAFCNEGGCVGVSFSFKHKLLDVL